jgi:hypothetical protein
VKNLSDSPPPAASLPRRFAAGLRRNAAALVIAAGFAAVVGSTGFVSYTHICALFLEAHQSWKTAHLTPVYIDGQIVIGSAFYMVVAGRARWWGMIGVVPGLLESLYANWESGIVHGRTDAALATIAAQAFAVSSFLFERWINAQVRWGTIPWPATAPDPQADDASVTPGGIIPEVPHHASPDVALQAFLDSAPDPVLAMVMNVSRNKIRALRDRSAAAGEAEDEPGAPPFTDVPRLPRLAELAEANGSGPHA